MRNGFDGLGKNNTSIREALASANGKQSQDVVKAMRNEYGQKRGGRQPSWQMSGAPQRGMVMRR